MRKNKAEVAQTFSLKDLTAWVMSSESFQSFDANTVNDWVRGYIGVMRQNLLLHRSMAFTPSGHLVVAKKSQRKLRLPNGQWCESPEGVSVRFRSRACRSGLYVKRADWVNLLQAVMPQAHKSLRLALYDCWVDFLKYAMASKARIEIRGLGGFHLHHRESVHSNLSHVTTKNVDKVYIRFAPSKTLMNELKLQFDN